MDLDEILAGEDPENVIAVLLVPLLDVWEVTGLLELKWLMFAFCLSLFLVFPIKVLTDSFT